MKRMGRRIGDRSSETRHYDTIPMTKHRELLAIAESQILHEVLRYTGGNLTQAAKRLGITRVTLRSRLEALGISVDRTTSVTQRNG